MPRILLLDLLMPLFGQAQRTPTQLRTDGLLHTDKVWRNGFLTSLRPDDDSVRTGEKLVQLALIRSHRPSFSWVVPGAGQQTAYRLILPSSRVPSQGTIWDSGKVTSRQRVQVLSPAPIRLDSNRACYWRVNVWTNPGGERGFSEPKVFRTAGTLLAYETPYYPLVKTEERPRSPRRFSPDRFGYDFRLDTFGQVYVTVDNPAGADTLVIHLGETVTVDGRIDTKPVGTLRYRRVMLPIQPGTYRYAGTLRPDRRNTGPKAIRMPAGKSHAGRFFLENKQRTCRDPRMGRALTGTRPPTHFSRPGSCVRASSLVAQGLQGSGLNQYQLLDYVLYQREQ